MPTSKKPKAPFVVSDWSDKAQVLKAVSRHGLDLQHASRECRDDPEVLLAAVKQHGSALEFASPALRNEREVVLHAVRQTGQALRFASQELRCDKDIVLAAVGVGKHGIALSLACEALQGDREVVLTAVSQQGNALRHASAELRADKKVVMAAMEQTAIALKYARAEVVENDGFMLEVRPFLEITRLYVFKAMMLSGRSCLAVVRPHQTKQDIFSLCRRELSLGTSTALKAEVLLGSDPMPEGAVEQISCLLPGELYEVQIVLQTLATADYSDL